MNTRPGYPADYMAVIGSIERYHRKSEQGIKSTYQGIRFRYQGINSNEQGIESGGGNVDTSSSIENKFLDLVAKNAPISHYIKRAVF
jgi:hypothetical protein